jgi:ATP/maltotriose-dependent transcriptional regulator MalT
VELLQALAGSLAATGQFDESRSALLESLRLVPDDEPALRVPLTVACAGVEQLLGRHAEARARLESTLEDLVEPRSPEAAALMISLAMDFSLAMDSFYRPTHDTWRPWIEQAIELSISLADRPLTATALAVASVLCSFSNEVATGLDYRAQAAVLIDEMPDAELAARPEAIVHLLGAEAYLERFDEAIVHGERALALTRATGQGALLPTLVPALWTAFWMRGMLEEGAELLDGAIEGTRLTGNNQTLVLLLMDRGMTAALAGDVQDALTLCQESWELAQEFEGSMIHTWSGFALGRAHMESGDAARAAELLVSSSGGPEMPLIPGVWRALALDWLTHCWLETGRRAEAERAAAASEAVSASTPLRLGAAWAQRARAEVALDAGDADEAAARALVSAAAADEVGARIEAAISRIVAGRALAHAGKRDKAAEQLEEAAAALHDCAAIRLRDTAERELRKLGLRVQRTPRGRSEGVGVDSLTERELQVARLVVDRRTNPEIAAELFLSLKTIETHMRNIFHKLGVSSRVDVARVVERAERDDRASAGDAARP